MKYYFSEFYDFEWGGGFTSQKVCETIDKPVTPFPIDERGFIDTKYLYTEEDERRFLNFIRSGDYTSAADYLDYVYYMKQSFSGLKRYLLYNIMNTVIRYISETVHDAEDFNNLVAPLFTHDTINGRFTALKIVTGTLCEHSQPRKGSKLCVRVRNYIEGHYLDQNLSVYSIADALGLHYVYLSSSFKKYSGEGIPTCINKIRISKSKYLLENLDESIESVGLAVGYSTLKTFIRVFKSIEGVTPSKYRDRIIAKQISKTMHVYSDNA